MGTIAVQVAKSHGVEVTGVDSAAKLEMMRAIGFDHVIDYRQEDFTRNGLRYDLIIDTRTNRWPFEVPALVESRWNVCHCRRR